MDLPRWRVPRAPAADPAAWSWDGLASLPPLKLSDGSGLPLQQTRVRVCWDDRALHVRFECEDRDAWGTYRRRDEPLYEEEAVEVFLAPGAADPTRYFEFEVSPSGVLFDAVIHNPTSRRIDLRCDSVWDCPGLSWAAGSGKERQDWWAELAIPWRGILPVGAPPPAWRANFYRIERPRDGEAELSAWSPTLARPADFHLPARFGFLELSSSR